MAVMFKDETKALIEALLFVSKEPLTEKVLSEVTGIEALDVVEIIKELTSEYESKKRGFSVAEIAGGYQFITRPEYASYIEKLYRPNSNAGLSKAALETLAIIAYKQPVTRAEVEMIRGVKIERALNTLIEKKLIQEVGRKEGIGRPILFGTTPDFLRHFGLMDIADLPPLDDVIVNEEDELE